MKTLEEQQAHAWSLAPKEAKCIIQDEDGVFYANIYDFQPVCTGEVWLSSAGGWVQLFDGEICNWYWQDTLQNREEFEAMTNKEWMPEVGQECLAWGENIDHEKMIEAYYIGNNPTDDKGMYKVFVSKNGTPFTTTNYRPLKTKADKEREEQEAELDELIAHSEGFLSLTMGQFLYEHNVRVLSENQFIGTKLSNRQVTLISSRAIVEQWSFTQVIKAVQDAIFGESE